MASHILMDERRREKKKKTRQDIRERENTHTPPYDDNQA